MLPSLPSLPSLLSLLSLLFSLMIGVLASEIESRNEKDASAVGAEGNALRCLASILRASAPAADYPARC